MKHTLHVRSESGVLIRHGTYTSYSKAIADGMRVAGYGNFFIDSGEYAPSRAQQLGQEKESTAERKRHILDTL